jgi:hypothetical protein
MPATLLETRTILPDVPRVGYDVHLCPFPGSLYACLQYLGDLCDYDYIMGVTGAAFRRLWNRDDGGNIDLSYFGNEPHRRIFAALGYEWRIIPAEKEAMVAAIVESIAQGKPAISFGIIGPPEAGIVAGYAEGGDVVYGWSYFQEEKDRYYEKRDWFETMDKNAGKGLILIGDKKTARLPDRTVLLASLPWAIDLARTVHYPGLPEHVGGLAAYDAWADALEVDADYPGDDGKVLETRVMVHGDQVVMLEERRSAAAYLRQMAKAVPEVAGDLDAAAAYYEEAATFAGKVWRWGPSMGREAQQGLADAQTRRSFAGQIRAAKAKESQAVAHLERALVALH